MVLIYCIEKVGSSSLEKMFSSYGIRFAKAHRFRRIPSGKFKIITPVREPVARLISHYFQSITTRERFDSIKSLSVNELRQRIMEHGYKDLHKTWFQNHFEPYTGIDIFSVPFDKKLGWVLPSKDILVYNCDIPDSTKNEIIGNFVGRRVNVPRVHQNDKRPFTKYVYPNFVKNVKFPKGFLDEMYACPYARHFFKVVGLKNKWIE